MFFRKKVPSIDVKEALFSLLDERYERFYDNKDVWQELRALDDCVDIARIHTQTLTSANTGISLYNDTKTDDTLARGDKTLIIPVKSKNDAIHTAKTLQKFFQDTRIQFIPEVVSAYGADQYRVHTNLDKQSWEKLCVFCGYRFNRELTPEEREAQQHKLHDEIGALTKKSDYGKWNSLEGVPTFIAMMGTPGILRQKESVGKKFNSKAKVAELNAERRSGPLLFRDTLIHIERSPNGKLSQYELSADLSEIAIAQATNGKPYREMFFDSIGGYPFKKGLSPTERAIEISGLILGTIGAFATGGAVNAVAGPIVTITVAGGVLMFTVADYKYSLIDRISNRLKNRSANGQEDEIEKEQHLRPMPYDNLDRIHEAYTGTRDPSLQQTLLPADVSNPAITPDPLVHTASIHQHAAAGRQYP